MKFRTEFEPTKASFALSPQKPVVLVGSCFSQNMARKMEEHLWRPILPTGTLYNPVSIVSALYMMRDKEKGKLNFEKSLFRFNDIWHSKKFDSSFSSADKNCCIEKFLKHQDEFLEAMAGGSPIIMTFGTAICYQSADTGATVGNCHKLPSQNFRRERLSVTDVWNYTNILIEELRKDYPEVKFIFTVSPVRHLKDGFVGNSRSKAILQLGVEEICQYNEGCVYFPAYEILNDDLRDYRFYAADLCHPSDQAIEYIWEIFCETFLTSSDLNLLKQNNKKYKSTLHRPLI